MVCYFAKVRFWNNIVLQEFFTLPLQILLSDLFKESGAFGNAFLQDLPCSEATWKVEASLDVSNHTSLH